MSEFLSLLVPDMISPTFATVLVVLSFFTSAIAAAIGLGGGVVLIAVMASAIPVAVVVPVHGVVQLGSNLGRAYVQREYINYPVIVPYLIGSVIGAISGGNFALALPDDALRIVMASFILWTAWGSLKLPKRGTTWLLGLGGAVITFLGMLMGATGPLAVSLFRSAGLDHVRLVGTTAAAMVMLHVLKIIVFGVLGFAFGPWVPLMAAMIVTGFLGTMAGSRLLLRMDINTFRLAFRVVLTLLALELLRRGVLGLL